MQLSSAPKDTIFAYVGDYLCWIVVGKNPQIKVVPVSSDEKDQTKQRTIKIENYLGYVPDSNLLSISALSPIQSAISSRDGRLNREELSKLANRLQVTTQNRVLVFDLDKQQQPSKPGAIGIEEPLSVSVKDENEPTAVDQLDSTERLLNP